MKSLFSFLIGILLFLPLNGQSAVKQRSATSARYVSLSGQVLSKGNSVDANGDISKFNAPVMHLVRTKVNSPKGTVLLLTGGDYKTLKIEHEGKSATLFLNSEGFDVAVLEYHVGEGLQLRNLALVDALQAFRLLQADSKTLGLRVDRLDIMGISSGAHLAARTAQKLGDNEQPAHLILISPSCLDEMAKGSVFPAVLPPVHPAAQLFVSFFENENKEWIHAGQEYSKTWKGYDGNSMFSLLNDSLYTSSKMTTLFDAKLKLGSVLKTFLNSTAESVVHTPNPATVPVEGYAKKRHLEKLALVANQKYDLIMIGNSITHNFEKPEYQPVWNQFFAPRKALNLGTSAYRTENLIWNIQHGELEGQSPKVVVLEIGTNNVDEKNYPTRHTAGQLAGGIESIVNLLREKLPDTKIIVFRCFPGCYGGPNPSSHRLILERASEIVSKLADGKHIFYCDVNHVFLNMDGSINHSMMGDWLHPTPAGAKAWAQAMEPLLSELMGDKSLDTDIASNSAIVPVSKLENDSYDWWVRHADVLHIKDSINPQIVLIGNSITHFWGGEPLLKYADGSARKPNGPKAWASVFGNYRVLNLGFGWDRTQNVLWRLDHGELDGLHPKTIIIGIGTNNTSQTVNARINTAPEIVEGIAAICKRVRSKTPGAKIVLMAVLPREQSPTHPRRILINEINKLLEVYANENKISFVNIGPKMLAPDGTLTRDMAGDFCHPTEKGYQVWADEIRSLVTEP